MSRTSLVALSSQNRECGQLYFFEFDELIDLESGRDPQYTKFIPVDTKDMAATLKDVSRLKLLSVSPRLQKDFPREADRPTLQWIGKD